MEYHAKVKSDHLESTQLKATLFQGLADSADQWSSWSDCEGNCVQSLQEFRSSQEIPGERSRRRSRSINSESFIEIQKEPCDPDCTSGGPNFIFHLSLSTGIDCAALSVLVDQAAEGPVYSLQTILARPSY